MDDTTSLNYGTRDQRLAALAAELEKTHERPEPLEEVNNHVHTYYSFSPYSPAAVAWKARQAGLQAVGSVDHDSISAAEEMLEAGKLADIGTTVGFEVRVNFSGTSIEGRKINNPDSTNLAYMVVHGVPRGQIARADEFLRPIRARRNERNQQQTAQMNQLLDSAGAPTVSWDEIVALSRSPEGGSITERHLLYAVSKALISWKGKGERLRSWVERNLTGELPGRLAGFLDDEKNPHYEYDLLGSMKSTFLPRFFVQPDEQECVSVATAVEFGRSIHAVPAYAYLGDVGESPTGDKKAEQFEDSYLDELFAEISRIGFRAVTYMPPRNTIDQLRRVQDLCRKHALMEISGVDINSSRQVFTCPEVMQPEFRHLVASTWALIAHEKLADHDENLSLFAAGNGAGTTLTEQIDQYAAVGRKMDRSRPEEAHTLVSW